MMSVGFAEILLLALLSGGVSDADIVSLVQPAHYFKTRQIEITIDRAVEYASAEPKDPKTQIVQLTALRYLADEAGALKKSDKYAAYRLTLEMIAQGKKAQDPAGFAKDYAQRVLMKLDNTRPEPTTVAPTRGDALAWFPADVTLAGAVDLRQIRGGGAPVNDPLKDLLKMMPDREKQQMYDFIEKCGNVRVERHAFAYKEGTGMNAGDGKIYMRVTGKGNQEWIVAAIQAFAGPNGRLQAKQHKDKDGTSITTLQDPNNPPQIMFIGNTDVLVVGHERKGNDAALGEDVLDTRAKKKLSAADGTLKKRLAKIPERAVAFMVGDIPQEIQRDLGRQFNPMPTNVAAFVERIQQGLDVQVETSLGNRDDADKFVQKVGGLRKDGIAFMQQAMKQPQPPGFPTIPYQPLINLLESLQVQSKDEAVHLRLVAPDGLVQQMMQGFMIFGGAGVGPPPPPPVKN